MYLAYAKWVFRAMYEMVLRTLNMFSITTRSTASSSSINVLHIIYGTFTQNISYRHGGVSRG